MARKYRVLRSGGQNVPPPNMQTMEFLQCGHNLITWPEPFPVEQALAAWRAHKSHVLAAWEASCAQLGAVPTCWAQRLFDNTPQINQSGLGYSVLERIKSIEANVQSLKGKVK